MPLNRLRVRNLCDPVAGEIPASESGAHASTVKTEQPAIITGVNDSGLELWFWLLARSHGLKVTFKIKREL